MTLLSQFALRSIVPGSWLARSNARSGGTPCDTSLDAALIGGATVLTTLDRRVDGPGVGDERLAGGTLRFALRSADDVAEPFAELLLAGDLEQLGGQFELLGLGELARAAVGGTAGVLELLSIEVVHRRPFSIRLSP